MRKKEIIHRALSLFLACVIFFGTIFSSGNLFAEGVDRVNTKITKFEIKDENGNPIPPDHVHGYYNKFRLEMDWDASSYGKTLKEGDYFIVKLPNQFKFPTEGPTVDFNLYVPGTNTVIARAHVNSNGADGGGTVKVTFTNYVVNRENIKGNLFLDASFAHKNINAGGPNTIVVSINGVQTSVTINIEKKPGLNNEIFAKWGAKVAGDVNKAKWTLRINHKKGHFSNVVIKDELFVSSGKLPPSIHYLKETFVLKEVEMDKDGSVTNIKQTYNYEQLKKYIKFLDNDTKFEFNLSAMLGNTSGKQFSMEYNSTYIPQLKLKNKGSFTSTEESGSSSSYFLSAQAGGGGQGDLNQKIKIIKIDEEDNTKKLANAKFRITKVADGSTFTLTTDSNGEAISEKLAPGKYKIKEIGAPLGYIPDGKEYDLTIVGGEALFYTVKNKRSKVKINVEKAWQDANDQDGKRPKEITVKLLADDKETDKQLTLKASEGWKGSFDNLDEYKDGKKIKYTIKELSVGEGYNSVISGSAENGFKVTNTREPEKVNISGEKTWDDANNQDGKRPTKITVKLMKKVGNGQPVEAQRQEVTKGADDKWKYEFKDLPKYENGKEIIYSIDEEAVAGYDKVITGNNIKNTHKPETVDISGEKTWDDKDNQDGKRPTTIKVKLMKKVGDANPVVEKTVEVKEGPDKKWTYEFKNLPKYENGKKITYTIDEEDVPGYDKAIKGNNIKNSHTPETVDVKGEKTWNDNNNQDGKRPEKITVKLMKKVGNAEAVVAQTQEVREGADKKWTYEFKNLPKYEKGTEITYSIEEEAVAGYVGALSGYNLTNTHTPETVDVKGEKTWDDANNQDGKRPKSITVKLIKQVENGQPVEVQRKEVKEGPDKKWTYEFKNLPKYENGKEIKYTIDEEEVTGYTKTIDGTNIKNSYTPGKVNISGEKTWDDANNQDGKRPTTIKVQLIKKVGDKAPEVVETKEVKEGTDKKWKYEFKDLPKYENGKLITYSIDEEEVPGYTKTIDGNNIKNSYTPGKTKVSGEKTWDDANNQDGKRPTTIKVKLMKKVEGGQPEVKEIKEVTKGADDKWTYEFKDLPKYEKGKLITYSIDEEEVKGYKKTIDGTNIKNSYTPGKVSIKVTKTWEDKDNQDGKRPASVTIKLFANGVETGDKLTLTKENGWKGSFDNLDEYKDGKKIDYSIEEEDIENGYKGFITQTSETEFNVINKREPEKTFVEGSKTWDDKENQDGKRPKEIKINLLKNGKVLETKTVTEKDGWKWKFENLDKYEKGQEIKYTISEEQVEGYTTEVTGNNVKNSYTPGKTSVQVTKAWEDKNNQDGVRPASVTIRLIADGVATDKTLTLTEANNWTGSFTDLDEYKDGTKIVYTVKEETVGNGYNSNVIGSAEDGFKVINTRQTEKVNVEGSKTWDDKENQDGKRPKEIKINLLKNGKVLETKTVTEKDGWKWKFENLDKYEKGQEIKYTISEEQVEGYTTEVTGNNVKNSYTPGKTSVQVTKAWEDKNNQDGVRPASVTIRLIADGVATDKTLTLTEANNWTGSFTDLDEYKAGKKIEYTVKEETVGNGYESKVTGSAKDGFTVTNTREPEKVNVEGSKTWDDKENQDGKRPKEIKINLLKNGKVLETKTVTEKDGWKWKFENLDKYEKGQEIKYTISEEQVEGYTTEVTGNNVKNSYTPGKTSVQVTKAWEDKNNQDGVRPASVTIRLIADGVATDKTLTLTEANNWTGSFTDLDEYKAGKKIEYTVEEEAIENGYESKVTGSAKDGFAVTNTREPEKTFVEGSKTWDDKENQDGKRPKEIKINLLKNGTVVETKTVTEAEGWKWKFENLDKYENGEEINYTITEEKVEGYTTVVKGSDVINTHAPGKTSVQVTKAWEDKNNQDGVRPASVTIRLIADGVETDKTVTLTKDNNWTGSFTDLDEYKDGKKIVYTVKEENVGNGYTSVVTKTGENNFTVTNIREPEKTFVEGSKTWDDKDNQDGKRPTEITINLLKNGTKVATKKVTEKDGWKWKFENLDKYENGELINYTIVEEKVEGYTTEVEGHNVKNSYTPGKTSVQVTKAWKDNNDQDKKRPDSVTIELLADGKETGKKVVLTKDNNWTGSFTDLDEYKDGKKIVYTVKEEAVGNGYKSVITGNAKEGFVVTNVRTPKPRIPKTGAGSNSALYTVLLGLSGTALFSVFRRKRKEEI